MRITECRIAGDELCLKSTDLTAIRRWAYEFKEGEYEIVKTKKKRSNDANAYFWVLVDKLSEKLNISKEEIYRNAIRNIGGVSETICARNEAVEKLRQGWRKNGLGWVSDTFPSKIAGCTNVILYYGSSTYSVEQMNKIVMREYRKLFGAV